MFYPIYSSSFLKKKTEDVIVTVKIVCHLLNGNTSIAAEGRSVRRNAIICGFTAAREGCSDLEVSAFRQLRRYPQPLSGSHHPPRRSVCRKSAVHHLRAVGLRPSKSEQLFLKGRRKSEDLRPNFFSQCDLRCSAGDSQVVLVLRRTTDSVRRISGMIGETIFE